MKFTPGPKLMGIIHKQFTESESETGIMQVILEAQLKTRQAVYEIANQVPDGPGDVIRKYYRELL